jgi:hypothetical protein
VWCKLGLAIPLQKRVWDAAQYPADYKFISDYTVKTRLDDIAYALDMGADDGLYHLAVQILGGEGAQKLIEIGVLQRPAFVEKPLVVLPPGNWDVPVHQVFRHV